MTGAWNDTLSIQTQTQPGSCDSTLLLDWRAAGIQGAKQEQACCAHAVAAWTGAVHRGNVRYTRPVHRQQHARPCQPSMFICDL